jgi:hypothetical protein
MTGAFERALEAARVGAKRDVAKVLTEKKQENIVAGTSERDRLKGVVLEYAKEGYEFIPAWFFGTHKARVAKDATVAMENPLCRTLQEAIQKDKVTSSWVAAVLESEKLKDMGYCLVVLKPGAVKRFHVTRSVAFGKRDDFDISVSTDYYQDLRMMDESEGKFGVRQGMVGSVLQALRRFGITPVINSAGKNLETLTVDQALQMI